MTDVLYPTDFAGRSRSYTKTTLGEPYERGQEPTVTLTAEDVDTLKAMSEAHYHAPSTDPA
jgi:hypothetical protein